MSRRSKSPEAIIAQMVADAASAELPVSDDSNSVPAGLKTKEDPYTGWAITSPSAAAIFFVKSKRTEGLLAVTFAECLKQIIGLPPSDRETLLQALAGDSDDLSASLDEISVLAFSGE